MIIGTTIAILILLTLSGFFSGSETALTAASRSRMHQLEKDGDKRAGKVNRLIANRERLIGAILLGNNLVNILASALATNLFLTLIPGTGGVVTATVVMTVLVLVFSEVLPKTYAITRPDNVAMSVARPIGVLVAGVSWIIAGIQVVVNATLKLLGVTAPEQITPEDDIRGTIDLHHAEDGLDAEDRHRLVGSLDLKDMTVEEVMIHRKNIVMIDADDPSASIVKQALNSPHTRLPLYRGDLKEIVGILHVKDLLRAVVGNDGKIDDMDILAICRDPWFTPETTMVEDQLDIFLQKRSHFSLVVDEYGALQGLVTLEDILEEIVGDIRDEHDVVVQGVRPQDDGSTYVEGWVTIRDLNRATGWDLPDEEAVTIAGLVIHEAQTIPEPGQRFSFHGHRFDIVRKTRNQITGLLLTPIPEDTE